MNALLPGILQYRYRNDCFYPARNFNVNKSLALQSRNSCQLEPSDNFIDLLV